jgi:hypothetical protein
VKGEQMNTQSGTVRTIRRLTAQQALDTNTVTFKLPRSIQQQFAATANVDKLRQHLTNIVSRAAGGSDQWTPPTFSVDLQAMTATLALSGRVACSIASVLAGEIQTHIHRYSGMVARHVQLEGSEVSRSIPNPRLMLLTSSAPISPSLSRDDAVLFLAHTLIWQAGCSIYGGFVRDWVINGTSANDVDAELRIPGQGEADRVENILQKAVAPTHIRFRGKRTKGAATCLSFFGPWSGSDVEVDLVDPNLPRLPPGVDCDVGNLAINATASLTKKVLTAGHPELPLHKCIQHCRAKKFVFFYNVDSDSTMCIKRITKYLSRGWTCLTPIPAAYLPQLSQYQSQLKPRQKYSRLFYL